MNRGNNTSDVTALAEGLERQIAALDAVRECLEAEHRALQLRDPEQLLAIVERKTNCIAEADRIERQCRQLDFDAAASDRTIIGKRAELDTLTRTCRELNEANGSLIRRQRARVETTLQILRGAPEESGVYGPTGDNERRGALRKLLASA